MADLYTFTVPTPTEYRDRFLKTVEAGLRARGIANPQVGPLTDFYVEATAVSNELCVNAANGIIAADALFPDTATGDALLAIAARYGLSLRGAAPSFGNIILSSTASTLVATGSQLTDSGGLRYEVTTGGTYANGDSIPVQALDPGDATNLTAGTSLQWRTAPAYSAPTALVAIGGLVNGTDAESEEGLRQRILARIQTPPGNGNWQHVAEIAEASSPSVQKAFIYPAAQGPSTVHVAVTAAPTASSLLRSLNSTLMSGTILPYITGQVPIEVQVTTTTVTNVFTTFALGLSLPSAPTASPAGPGGGWLDGTPWPQLNPTGGYHIATITGTLTPTTFQFGGAPTAPIPGVSRIAFYSYTDRKLFKATVIGWDAGFNIVTIDTPWTGMSIGSPVFPQCANQDQYVAAILAAFELMGPGEKTTNVSALIRAYRHPVGTTSWPSGMGPNILRALTDAGDEVSSAQFTYRNDGVTTSTGSGGNVYPQVPASITDPPNIYVPFRFGLYPTPA